MARDVADAELLYEVMAGPDDGDPYSLAGLPSNGGPSDWCGLRVAWLPRCGNVLDPEVEEATLAAVRGMEARGAVVEEIALDFVALEPVFLVILQSALAARLADKLPAFRDRLDPSLVETIEKGSRLSGVEVQKAGMARTACFREVQAIFRKHDVIVSPTLSAPPLPVDQDPNGRIMIAGVDAGTIRGAWYPYTYPFNLTGHPALSLPCGQSRFGLPVGLQIVGPWHSDQRLLHLAGKLHPPVWTAN
jgi:aspartyl-tRNA(Asn)/glutamyl-tRNA(Gln) amidotransferase subunit A